MFLGDCIKQPWSMGAKKELKKTVVIG